MFFLTEVQHWINWIIEPTPSLKCENKVINSCILIDANVVSMQLIKLDLYMFQTAIQLHDNKILYVLAIELNYEKLNWFELRP
jgi:hypothetical protein